MLGLELVLLILQLYQLWDRQLLPGVQRPLVVLAQQEVLEELGRDPHQ